MDGEPTTTTQVLLLWMSGALLLSDLHGTTFPLPVLTLLGTGLATLALALWLRQTLSRPVRRGAALVVTLLLLCPGLALEWGASGPVPHGVVLLDEGRTLLAALLLLDPPDRWWRRTGWPRLQLHLYRNRAIPRS